ncbi:MAG: hypothetical protein HOD63_09110 [Bacteroidetes bacterium]|jgi:putative transposase|nr:hypothetical protein [Bacteroidota bacterium]MBT3933063.1 hypothetical protein [Bacteroidota bacterium]MBT4338736.1 hypothetical protein [Bacteroidota bacterium]MBT5989547.1 hypothetical protein [Bacteroidota bacterium]MBT6837485.1 hypothetical protein [Bacteroidota bacterium]
MYNFPLLEAGEYYHIYNRGIGKQTIFRSSNNYQYFIEKALKYLHPILEIISYCLLKNHFHFFVKIKTIEEQLQFHKINNPNDDFKELIAGKQFSKLFNSYAQAFNKSYNRSGSLFEKPFKRIPVSEDDYITLLIFYIHSNPVKHGIISNFYDYPYSSYTDIIKNDMRIVNSDFALKWFGELEDFISFHKEMHDLRKIDNYLLE